MLNSRRSQPYRRNTARAPGPALSAMLRGRTAYGRNPADARRAFSKRLRRRYGTRRY